MAARVAVGLDGQIIPPEEAAKLTEVTQDADSGPFAIAVLFDTLPKWARDALREHPKYDVRLVDIVPHIRSGVITPFNIREQLSANDARQRAHFREQDRANGLA